MSSKILPCSERDQLRTLLAVCGFSAIECGAKMSKKKQMEELSIFYLGQPPNKPSQLKMLCEGVGKYSALYDEYKTTITGKNGKMSDVSRLYLKFELIRNCRTKYFVGEAINYQRLETLYDNNKQIVSGCALHNWAEA